MKIDKKTPCLFLRLANFKSYDYIVEHKKVLDKYNSVWLLKVGKIIDKSFIKEIIEHNGGIILKTPARTNNKYYFCHLISNSPSSDIINYPEYYQEYFEYEGYDFNTTLTNENWFLVDSMVELNQNDVEKFVTIKSQNKISNCIRSRAVFMYIENTDNINI